MKQIIVTGGAGFIGSHLVDRLLLEGWQVTAIDNFDPFYSREMKENNISLHKLHPNYTLLELDITDINALTSKINGHYDAIVHLAAKAGVRPSIEDPLAYQDVNVRGTQNLLELAKQLSIKHFVFASSSSVYGVNPNLPWRETDNVLLPISPYASTKISGELLGHVYSHLYGIGFTALRFFTVYGPRQRPDLAISKFVNLILRDSPIPMFGNGETRRDYTYIDDIIDGIVKSIASSRSGFRVINLGNSETISLSNLIEYIEGSTNTKARVNRLPLQAGDLPETWADISYAEAEIGFKPKTQISKGIEKFVAWVRDGESSVN